MKPAAKKRPTPAQPRLPLFPDAAPKPSLTLAALPYDPERSGAELAAMLAREGIGRATLAVRLGLSLAAVRDLLAGVGDLDRAWEAAEAIRREQWADQAPAAGEPGPCGFCGQRHPLGRCHR